MPLPESGQDQVRLLILRDEREDEAKRTLGRGSGGDRYVDLELTGEARPVCAGAIARKQFAARNPVLL